MADKKTTLNIDSNVTEIRKTLENIQKIFDAINKIKKNSLDADNKELKNQKEIKKFYDEQRRILQEKYKIAKQIADLENSTKENKDKANHYNDIAKAIKSKFSFENLASDISKHYQKNVSNKYNNLRDYSKTKYDLDIQNTKLTKNWVLRMYEARHAKTPFENFDDIKANIAERYNKKIKGFESSYNTEKALLDAQEANDLSKIDVKTGKANVAISAATAIVNAAKKVASVFNNLSKSFLGISFSIKDAFSDVLKDVSEMTSMTKGMATYATGSSLITNSAARQTQMKYGLNDSQTYAFTQTSSLLGISSDEDLMYMNQSQKQVFTQYMQKYSSWYEQLMSSGALQDIQEMQLEFAMFKQEIAVELLQFVAQNKDTILAAAKGIISILEWVMKIATKLLGGILGTGSSSSSSTANNVTVNVSYTDGGSGSNQMESFVSGLSRSISTAIGGV
jgi:hypothetical protein